MKTKQYRAPSLQPQTRQRCIELPLAPSRPQRRRSVFMLWLALAIATSSLSAQAQHTDAGTTVQLDLSRGRFTTPVPFDVQFYIETTLDARIVQIDGRFRQIPDDGSSCPAVLGDLTGTNPLPGRIFQTTDNGTTTRKAEFSVSRLDPNVRACFEFTTKRRLTEDRLRQVRRSVQRELDRTLRGLDDPDGLALETPFDEFRFQVIDAVADSLAAGEELTDLPSGSFFDRRISARSVATDYMDLFVALLDIQDQRATSIQEAHDARAASVDSFRRLLDDPSFRTMTRLLRAAQDDTPLLTTPERKRALELGRWTGDEHAAKLAFGLYPPRFLEQAPSLQLSQV